MKLLAKSSSRPSAHRQPERAIVFPFCHPSLIYIFKDWYVYRADWFSTGYTDNTFSCYRVKRLRCGLFDPWPVHATNKTTSEGTTALMKLLQTWLQPSTTTRADVTLTFMAVCFIQRYMNVLNSEL